MKNALMVLGIVLFIGGITAYNISIWKECRQTNSWGYCMKVLSR